MTDSFYFVHQPLAGNGSITVQVTSLAGQRPHARSVPRPRGAARPAAVVQGRDHHQGRAPRQGSAYAAMMVTGGHGVRMQWDYTSDTPGLAGAVSAAAPRWLRLTRYGDTITGYDSADGTHWTRVGTATLPGLPSTVQAGLFAAVARSNVPASPPRPRAAQPGHRRSSTTSAWTGTSARRPWTGTDRRRPRRPRARRRVPPGAGTITVTGSGDIAPVLAGATGRHAARSGRLAGTFVGLIAVIVVGAMFITAEYRRGLIRVTLTASPRRGRVLAAKAVVIGAVTFVAGLPAAAIALAVGERDAPRRRHLRLAGAGAHRGTHARRHRRRCSPWPRCSPSPSAPSLRRSAAAVTAAIVVIVAAVLPRRGRWPFCPPAPADWLLRITPAAGFSVQQVSRSTRRSTASYTPDVRLLPAGAVDRASRCCAPGPPPRWPGRLPAAAEGRMSLTARALRRARSAGRRTAARGVDQAPHRGRHRLAAARRRRADRRPSARPRPPRRQLPRPAACGRSTPPRSASPASTSARRSSPSLAVLAIGNEYSTGMIRVTLTAMPRRLTVLSAKAAVLTGLVLVAERWPCSARCWPGG